MYSILYVLETAMDTLTYTAARASLADTMDRVVNEHEQVIITRGSQQ